MNGDWKYFNCFSAMPETTVKIQISQIDKPIIVSFIHLKASATDLAIKVSRSRNTKARKFQHQF